ncbi:MAG: 50S ribosomal protein L10 [Candidatus Woesearchaeota archaeon]
MNKPKPHVSDMNKAEVKELVALLKKYSIIGVVDMENMPAPQLLKMRTQLHGKALIRMSKGRLIRVAFDLVKDNVKGIDQLNSHLTGMPALILTNENPFKLYKIIQKSKSAAPAKPGQKAPNDITIQAGPTPFAPGPIIGELGALGLKTAIENGKVAIKADKLVVREGELITDKVAGLLTRFGIEPMEIGLNLVAVLEDGVVFTKGILAVDEKQYIADIKKLSSEAMNLAVFAGYASQDTIKLLIAKAYRNANGLAESRDIMTSDNVKSVIAKAERQMQAVKAKTE